MNWFDSNNCGNSMHCFMRDKDGFTQAYHLNDTICVRAEFRFVEMLQGDVETFSPDEARLQQCMKDTEHLDEPMKGQTK